LVDAHRAIEADAAGGVTGATICHQNLRGGRVKLQSIIMPDMEFGNTEKGDALYAMELALSLEKLNNEKLLALHKVAEECDDPQMTDFVEGDFLGEQVRRDDALSPSPLARDPLHSACPC